MPKTPPPPPKAPPAPSNAKEKRSPRATLPDVVDLQISSGVTNGADRIVIYGTGGIGKSTLAAYLPAPLFLDVERSTNKLNVARDTASEWYELRGKCAAIAAQVETLGIRTVVIDSVTIAEELAKEHVIANRRAQRSSGPDAKVESIEDFGWGKGWQFVFDEFQGLLADLDRIAEKGINVCMIAHDVSTPVPNPMGEDFIRWEPHLYSGDKKGRGSIRERVKQWADHVVFIAYDIFVTEGKGQGSGTRTIHTVELPTHIAKSRTEQFAMNFTLDDPGAVWKRLGIQ